MRPMPFVLLLATLHTPLFAAQATINMRADDNISLYINGQAISIPAISSGDLKGKDESELTVDIPSGHVVVAAKVVNGAYGGGLAMSIKLAGGKTIVTDPTWKMTFADPGDGWMNASYDDASWDNANDFGAVDTFPGVANWRDRWAPLYEAGAHFIWTNNRMCFRKSFQSSTANNSTLYAHAMTMEYRILLNGEEVGAETKYIYDHSSFSGMAMSIPAAEYPVSLRAGTNVIALEAIQHPQCGSTQGMFQAVIPGTVRTDDTWKVSDAPADGWTTVDFDDSQWSTTGKLKALYDESFAGNAKGGELIWPTTVYFRKRFSN